MSLAVAGASLLLLSACGGDSADDAVDTASDAAPGAESAAAGDAARPAFGLVTAAEAAALAADPAITVIDVRTPEEYAEGHLEGAVLIDLSSPTFADEIAALDPAQPYLVYCRSGNRSGQAVVAMQQVGFDQLWDMDGGVIAWSEAGLSLDS